MKHARLVLMAIAMFTFLGTSLAFTSAKKNSDVTYYYTFEVNGIAYEVFYHAKITIQGEGIGVWYTNIQGNPAIVFGWITFDIE